jgi:ABC-type multidrug transport system permease subunit
MFDGLRVAPALPRRWLMSEPRPTSQDERDESPSERADRNFSELVQELRVSQTGVQILFAFLLTLAFSGSFPDESTVFSYVLTAALLAAACSSLCFMAPVVVHRTSFRLGGKDRLVWVTHRFAMAGLVLLALAMLLSIWIVIAYLFTYLAAHVISGVLAAVVVVLWVVVPLHFRAEVTDNSH